MQFVSACLLFAALVCQAGHRREEYYFDPAIFLSEKREGADNPIRGFSERIDPSTRFTTGESGAGFTFSAKAKGNRWFPRADIDSYSISYFRLRHREHIRFMDGVYLVTDELAPTIKLDTELSKQVSHETYVIPFAPHGSCMLHRIAVSAASGKGKGEVDVTLYWTDAQVAGKEASGDGRVAVRTVKEGDVLLIGGHSRIVRKINFGDKKTGLRGYVEIDQVPLTREQIAEYEKKRKTENAADKPAPDELKEEAAAKSDDSKDRLVFSVEKDLGGVKRWQYAEGGRLGHHAIWRDRPRQIMMEIQGKFPLDEGVFIGLVETSAESRMRLEDAVYRLLPGEPVTFVKDDELSKKVKPNTIYFHFAPRTPHWSFLGARIQVISQIDRPNTAIVNCTHPKHPEDKFIQMVKEGDELLIAEQKFKVVTVVMPDEANSLIGWIELDMKPIQAKKPTK